MKSFEVCISAEISRLLSAIQVVISRRGAWRRSQSRCRQLTLSVGPQAQDPRRTVSSRPGNTNGFATTPLESSYWRGGQPFVHWQSQLAQYCGLQPS